MEPLAQQQPSYKIRKWVGLEGQGLEGQGPGSKTCTIVIGGRVRSGKSYAAASLYDKLCHIDLSSNFAYFHSEDKHDEYINYYPSGRSYTYEIDPKNDDLENMDLIIAEPYWILDYRLSIHPCFIEKFLMNRSTHTTYIQTCMFHDMLPKNICEKFDYIILTRGSCWGPAMKRTYDNYNLHAIFGSIEIFRAIYENITSTQFCTLVIHLSCNSRNIEDSVFWYTGSVKFNMGDGFHMEAIECALPKLDI